MAVTIRFARIGKKKYPFYRIVVMDKRAQRNGRAIEILGTYDPIKGHIVQFNAERAAHWVSVGATESDAVKKVRVLHARAVQQ